MRALTLHRPWAWAVAAGFKSIENRPWAPPLSVLRHRIAIHAGKTWDDHGAGAVATILGPGALDRARAQDVPGAIVAVANVEGWVGTGRDGCHDPAQLSGELRRWFVGPYGWILRDVKRLANPISVRGFQRLWTLPPEIEQAVVDQIASVREASNG